MIEAGGWLPAAGALILIEPRRLLGVIRKVVLEVAIGAIGHASLRTGIRSIGGEHAVVHARGGGHAVGSGLVSSAGPAIGGLITPC